MIRLRVLPDFRHSRRLHRIFAANVIFRTHAEKYAPAGCSMPLGEDAYLHP